MHVVLQTGSQSHALRLRLYASSPHLQVFPQGQSFCTAAEELDIVACGHTGSCLVLLHDCKVSPKDFHRHITSTFLRGYVVRLYWLEYTTTCRDELVSHVNTLVEQCLNSPCHSNNEVVAHRNEGSSTLPSELDKPGAPVEGIIPTEQLLRDKSCSDFGSANEALSIPEKLKVRMQTHPRSLAESLADKLEKVDCQPHGFSQTLYVLQLNELYRYGLSSGKHMYLAPCDREDLAKDYIARAALKLEEVTQVCGYSLTKDMIALDIGASPGAWTQFLSKHVRKVVAVDPGELNHQALKPNVVHVRKLAQDAAEELTALNEGQGYDLVVCDVNRHPVEAAKLLSPLLTHLKKGGLVVFTLKFHGRGRDKEQKIEEIKGILGDYLTQMECIWLLANSIYERTFVGVKI